MPSSTRFQQLDTRIKEIETNLLPAINIAGNYSNQEIDFTRSYCLLCHAEIEAYLEDITLEVVRVIFTFWKSNNSQIPDFIFNMVCYYKNKSEMKGSASQIVHLSMKAFEDAINKNHGIKSHNLDNIFLPIGYSMDKTLMTVLHSFGDTRGDIAHKSFQTQQQIDPQTEKNNINTIVKELAKFDSDFFKNITPTNTSGLKNITRTWWQKLFRL
jgi:hypothetical protein